MRLPLAGHGEGRARGRLDLGDLDLNLVNEIVLDLLVVIETLETDLEVIVHDIDELRLDLSLRLLLLAARR